MYLFSVDQSYLGFYLFIYFYSYLFHILIISVSGNEREGGTHRGLTDKQRRLGAAAVCSTTTGSPPHPISALSPGPDEPPHRPLGWNWAPWALLTDVILIMFAETKESISSKLVIFLKNEKNERFSFFYMFFAAKPELKRVQTTLFSFL